MCFSTFSLLQKHSFQMFSQISMKMMKIIDLHHLPTMKNRLHKKDFINFNEMHSVEM
jgi:hypothetical protein